MEPIDLTVPPYRAHTRYLTFTVLPAHNGTEIGVLLRQELKFSAGAVKRMKRLPDGICLAGARATTRTRVQTGQTLRLRLSDISRSGEIVPATGPLTLVFEDEDLLVLNKAPGLAIHPGIGHWTHTLGSFVLAYYDSHGIPADFHPVQRLDKGTSGLMVVAKHAYAQELLRQNLHTANFQREYLAVCDGVPAAVHGTIDLPLAHSATSVIRQEISTTGLPAQTHYRVLRSSGTRSLVHLRLETGRTHQIRVHMAAIGCPLTGDFLYGTENTTLIARPALHAHRLSFRHPVTWEHLSFTAALPADMAALLP